MNYQGFKIECFEAGKDLWHARIRCEERTPVEIDGVLFSVFELGFAWPRPEAAIADAQVQIDRLNRATPPARADDDARPPRRRPVIRLP